MPGPSRLPHHVQPGNLTPAWLARVTGLPVTAARVERVGGTFGMLSGLARVHLGYADEHPPGAPDTVVVKLPSPVLAAIGEELHAFEREARFYRDLASASPVRTPRCFGVSIDPGRHEYVVVQEDLTGLEPGDQVAGLALDRAEQAIRAIAPFHARWWHSPELDRLGWMPEHDDTIEAMIHPGAGDRWAHYRATYGVDLEDGWVEIGQRVHDGFDALLAALASAPQTIAHFDYRADNLLFDAAAAEPVVVLDWQLAIRGPGALDVARLLCGSVRPSERRGRFRELVELWRSSFVRHGVDGYDADAAWRDFRNAALFCLHIPVANREAQPDASARMRQLIDAMTERIFPAVAEIAAVEALGREAAADV